MPTRAALQDRLQERLEDRPYHLFHYIGHGEFDEVTNEGYLLLEDENGGVDEVSGEKMGIILRDHSTLRLAVLNACKGARVSSTHSYAGVAQKLLINGDIPAVIAMQFKISDFAAIMFARNFYKAIANGYPIDAALSETRKNMYVGDNDVEWATPVLYMRTSDGHFFDIKLPSASTTETAADKSAIPDAPGKITIDTPVQEEKLTPDPFDEHYQSVIDAIRDGKLVPFLGLDINLYGRQRIDNWEIGNPLPSSKELTAYLAKSFSHPDSCTPGLVYVSQYATVMKKGPGQLYDKMAEVFTESNYVPTPIHEFFARLIALLKERGYPRSHDPTRRRFVIVAFNYDNLLERAFNLYVPDYHVVSYVARGEDRGKFLHSRVENSKVYGKPAIINDPNACPGLMDQDPVILKLPGAVDTDTANQMFAITEDHFFDYPIQKELPVQLTGKLMTSKHLFLGYDLRDWYLRALVYRIWDDKRPPYESWAVHPAPNQIDKKLWEVDKKFWEACDVESINVNLKEYISKLDERIQSI